jgi:hypothetical protein
MARPKGVRNNPFRQRLPFRQSEIERALRAARRQGVTVTRIDIEPRTGKISIGIEPATVFAQPEADVDTKAWTKAVRK